MSKLHLPFQPIRSELYSIRELYQGFESSDPQSFARTRDFLIYVEFVKNGSANSGDYLNSMMQSLHDNSITIALRNFLEGKKCVAIMGGHEMRRDDPAYAQIVQLSRRLTNNGFLLASGGGPGAMEATHLGALTAKAPREYVNKLLQQMAGEPPLPDDMKEIVKIDGSINHDLVARAHAWLKPVVEIYEQLETHCASVSIPTWLYGHEPSTPFATHIAKYFQNSIREDGLLAIANYGVIFAQGRAGTIQEIFQDANQNYYQTFGFFSPMVFLGSHHWRNVYPVWPLVEKLFASSKTKEIIHLTDDIEEAVNFIASFAPPPGPELPSDQRHN